MQTCFAFVVRFPMPGFSWEGTVMRRTAAVLTLVLTVASAAAPLFA